MASFAGEFKVPSIPRDSEGFVKSFTFSDWNDAVADEARSFFDEFGFVVVANVFTSQQCSDTISDIWNVIESSIRRPLRNNEDLWGSNDWAYTGISHEGIIGAASLWTPQIILNRQTPALHNAFAAIFRTEKLLVNHDRYAMFRPALKHPERGTMTNLHLDMNPWRYCQEKDNAHQIKVLSSLKYNNNSDWITENNEPGCQAIGELHVQGLVNLADNVEEDGGFWLVPGFHRYLSQWTAKHESLKEEFGLYSTFILLDKSDIPELYAAACHIATRAGSAIIWDQRVMHGSRENRSLRPRFAQFFKMFPVAHPAMTSTRAENRRNGILAKLRAANLDPDKDLSLLGRRLFGLAEWSDST